MGVAVRLPRVREKFPRGAGERQPGDRIRVDLAIRAIELLASDEVLSERRALRQAKGWKPEKPRKRDVSTALRAYPAFATRVTRGAEREAPQT